MLLKAYIVAAIVLVIFSPISVCGEVLSNSRDINISMRVLPRFKLHIVDENIDMGFIMQGKSTNVSTSIYCFSNQGTPWAILLQCSQISGAHFGEKIPLSNFAFTTTPLSGDSGNPSKGEFVQSKTQFTGSKQLAYRAHESEYADTEVGFNINFSIDVPIDAKADMYGITVTCTMTEL